MNFDDIDLLPMSVQQYLRIYLSSTRGRSDNTVLSYASDLRLFFKFIISLKNKIPYDEIDNSYDMSYIDFDFIEKINTMDIYKFIEYNKRNQKMENTSNSRKISALRGYFGYICVKMGYLKNNPMEPIDTPKLKKTLPKYLTLNQSIELLNSVEGQYKERDYCILTVFLNCGLRVAELVDLNISDIDFDEKTIIVTGKGNKQRKLYLSQSALNSIIAYLKVRPHDNVIDKDALFLSHINKRITRRGVQLMTEKYLNKIGLGGKGYSVHKLRHTAATLMYQQGGVDVLVLKEVLGHENLSTTQIYTHVGNDQLKQAAENNPLNFQNDKKSKL